MSGPAEWLKYFGETDSSDALECSQQLIQGFSARREAWSEQGAAASDIDALYDRITQRIAAESFSPRSQMITALETAAEASGARRYAELHPDDALPAPMPSWPSGLTALDNMTGGGPCGFVCFAGDGGVGKSASKTRALVEASRASWRVFDIDAENTDYTSLKRLQACCGGRVSSTVIERLRMMKILGRGVTPMDVVEWVAERIQPEDDKVLIALDSVNRLAKNAQGNYFDELSVWNEFARLSVLYSAGAVSFITCSETNAGGGDKGREAEFSADLLLRINKSKDPASDVVDMVVGKNRHGRKGVLGPHVIDIDRCYFEPLPEGSE